MSLGPSSGRETPGYPDRSTGNTKISSRKRTDASTGSFIELDDRTSSNDGKSRRTSLGSHGSEVPITERLVPGKGKGYGYDVHTMVNAKDVGGKRAENGDKSNAIWMTQTVDVQRHPDSGRF